MSDAWTKAVEAANRLSPDSTTRDIEAVALIAAGLGDAFDFHRIAILASRKTHLSQSAMTELFERAIAPVVSWEEHVANLEALAVAITALKQHGAEPATINRIKEIRDRMKRKVK